MGNEDAARNSLTIFYSYVHEDELLRIGLEKHLSGLRYQDLIKEWHDQMIIPGADWSSDIDHHLMAASIVLLLISPDYMASNYYSSIAMQRVLERHQAGEVHVIPILLRPVDLDGTPFVGLQCLPRNRKPVTSWSNRDKAFLEIAKDIRQVITKIQTSKNNTKTDLLPFSSLSSEEITYRSINAIPPPTHSQTIHQRENIVKEIYLKLIQANLTGIVLTGIAGAGKSTLAALIYNYAEELRRTNSGPFKQEGLWFRVDPSVTMSDIIGNIFDRLGKPVPNLNKLSLQAQIALLLNALNTVDQPRLIVLDQFENLLDWQTGHALPDRAGVGEWIDAINSQLCLCKILLTSRPYPSGAHEYPRTFLYEYPVIGFTEAEGTQLLQKRGLNSTKEMLRLAVSHCEGHPFALSLLVSLLQKHNLSLKTLLSNPMYTQLWVGNIAHNLLDAIYTQQLDQEQRALLIAFSVYREPILLDAIQDIMHSLFAITNPRLYPVLDILLAQHLIQAAGEGYYQLHAIVASYMKHHLVDNGEQTTLQLAHSKAAKYYLDRIRKHYSPQAKQIRLLDVHDFVEGVWHLCQANQWLEAYKLMEQEEISADLRRWGNNAILLELYQMLLPPEKWQAGNSQIANIYLRLGEICRILAQNDLGIKYSEEALAIYRSLRKSRGECAALNTLGRIYNALGQKELACECYQKALHICREIEEYDNEDTILNNLGRVYTDLNDEQQAQQCYEMALSRSRGLGKRDEEGRALHGLGLVCQALGQKEKARNYFNTALNILKEVKEHAEEGKVLNSLGALHVQFGIMNKAQEYFEQAICIHRELGNRNWEYTAWHNLGVLYLHNEDPVSAAVCLTLAKNISEQKPSLYISADTLQVMIKRTGFTDLLSQADLRLQLFLKQLST